MEMGRSRELSRVTPWSLIRVRWWRIVMIWEGTTTMTLEVMLLLWMLS
jgi:hypothetical protein